VWFWLRIWLALTWIDFKTFCLPTHLTNALLWFGLFFNLFGHFTTISSAVLGVIVGYVTLSVIYWVFKMVDGSGKPGAR
jgi:leader peptidase (prepilin peptidase)/N-methyltransferase